MCLLIETIKIKNRKARNPDYHSERCNRSRKQLFGTNDNWDLKNTIAIPEHIDHSVWKCRILYDREIRKIEFLPYKMKTIKSLKIVNCNSIDYAFKFADRQIFALLTAQKDNADDVLIVKNGNITDTSFANIIFWNGKHWITPSTPLLKGTKRQYLLDTKQIYEEQIKPGDLSKFSKAKLINAMIDIDDSPVIDVKKIQPASLT